MLRSNPREAAFLTVKKAQTMALDEVEDDDREYVAGAKQHAWLSSLCGSALTSPQSIDPSRAS